MSDQRHRTKITDATTSEFFETVLTNTPSSPEADYGNLSEAWRKATGADWLWLWLIHNPGGAYSATQLVARSPIAQSMPARNHVRDSKSVSAYCARTGKIEVVEENFKEWKRHVGSDAYSVGLIEDLREMGCRQFICIPIHMPALSGGEEGKAPAYMPVICGSMCVHYKQRYAITPRSLHLLRRMGQLSAFTLLNSYQALQRTILIELDQITHQYLTDRNRDREQVCRQYAEAVTSVIGQKLQVKGVSIFYRDSVRGGVQCLASTGLAWGNGQKVKDVSAVHYARDEGLTGTCYMTGKPLVVADGHDIWKLPKTMELIDGHKQIALPVTLYPIPLPKNELRGKDEPGALGVIRCKYHHSELMEDTGLCFDSIELQTLEFIARQIAPALEIRPRIRKGLSSAGSDFDHTLTRRAREFTSYWSKIDRSHIDRFIAQFPVDMRWLGESLIEAVDYYDDHFFTKALTTGLSCLNPNSRTDLCLCPLGSARKSPGRMAYDIHPSIKIPYRELRVAVSDDRYESIVFADDCALTGIRTVEDLSYYLGLAGEQKARTDIEPLSPRLVSALRARQLIFVVGIGSNLSYWHLEQFLTKQNIRHQILFHKNIECLSPAGIDAYQNGSLWDDNRLIIRDPLEQLADPLFSKTSRWIRGGDWEAAKAFCEDVGYSLLKEITEKKGWTDKWRRDSSLGSGGIQGRLVFQHTVPKPTLTLLWCKGIYRGEHWLPLFQSRD